MLAICQSQRLHNKFYLKQFTLKHGGLTAKKNQTYSRNLFFVGNVVAQFEVSSGDHVLVDGKVSQKLVLLSDVGRLFAEGFEISFRTIDVNFAFCSTFPVEKNFNYVDANSLST